MFDLLTQPWPWYIAGPIIGLMVPILLKIGNKPFGVSSNFEHICAAFNVFKIQFFKYNWKKETWNLTLISGVVIGGFLGGWVFANPEPIRLSASAIASLQKLGITDFSGLVPAQLFNWGTLKTWPGIVMLGFGGFLIGFGTRYAKGCTSGHAITGLSNLQRGSLIAVIGFFIGGLITTWVLLPLIL